MIDVLYRALRPLLFQLDAERAHHLAFFYLRLLERWAPAAPPTSNEIVATRLWGLDFPNPVGLAAGFDKNAAVPHAWPALGFGFAELGTITAKAQPGNPQPRLFRLPADRALINRMGFNNDGAEAIAAQLTQTLTKRRAVVPIGINLGKSKITPLEDAPADYVESFRRFFDLGDYFVINVSSPNTPGLRDLQGEDQIDALAGELMRENHRLAADISTAPKPVLIKVAPDLADEGLQAVVNVALRHSIAGLVATNTTIARTGLRTKIEQQGGLSGAPLTARATEVIRTLYRMSEKRLPIIGVGGIFGAADAYEKIRAGASLVQIYTGFIYEGPTLPSRIATGLAELLRRDGFARLHDAVGIDA